MIKAFICLLFLTSSALAYVPTVESLFRFGSNADVTSNGISLSFVVRRMNAQADEGDNTVKGKQAEEFYRIHLTKVGSDTLKVAQARFRDSNFSENGLDHKIYYPNFTPHTMKPTPDQMEKGLFYALLHSMAYNNGSQMVTYLKDLGVPVKHNSEILNRQKIDYLASYKKYLVTINNDRAAKKTEKNPLQPEDPAARERVEAIMNESMYMDAGHVKLGRDEGQMAWVITADNFESVISYQQRSVQKYKYKTGSGEFSVTCKDYWLANGTHFFPKTMQIKTLNGESFELDVVELRHYQEKEDDLIRRQKRWDQALKGQESTNPRPAFLL